MRFLYVGDPHATPDAIPEMEKLIDFIIKVANKEDVLRIVFLGDQYHTHSIIHLNVLGFWNRAFHKLRMNSKEIYALVGNHDRSGSAGSTDNAMMVHDNINVIEKPHIFAGVLFLPYMHDATEFVKTCNLYPHINTLVCHQTFDGSHYENGFYAKDGIDASLIPQQEIISGHIHDPQTFGKVWYPGAPRWRTVSDANTARAIWVVDHDVKTGKILSKNAFDTSKACIPIFHVIDNPDHPYVPTDVKGKYTVDVHGPVNYIKDRAEYFGGLGYRVRTFPTKNFTSTIKESDGIKVALSKFIEGYRAKNSTSNDRLTQLVMERVKWMGA